MSAATEILLQMLEAQDVAITIPLPLADPCIRLHPDDYEAFLRERPIVMDSSPDKRFFGTRICKDESAERLPRRYP